MIAGWTGRGPLNEGLAQEFRTAQAPVHPGFTAAAVGGRSNTGISLKIIRFWIALSLFSKGDQQARGENGTGVREALEEDKIIVLVRDLGDMLIEEPDGLEGDPQLANESFDRQGVGICDAFIGG